MGNPSWIFYCAMNLLMALGKSLLLKMICHSIVASVCHTMFFEERRKYVCKNSNKETYIKPRVEVILSFGTGSHCLYR